MTSRIPYKDPYVVKSQLVEQNDPFLINEIACNVWSTLLVYDKKDLGLSEARFI